jgi:hypothetical protein
MGLAIALPDLIAEGRDSDEPEGHTGNADYNQMMERTGRSKIEFRQALIR